jgi:hypothetical protein
MRINLGPAQAWRVSARSQQAGMGLATGSRQSHREGERGKARSGS